MKVILDGLTRFKPYGEAVKVLEKIELENKMEMLQTFLEDRFGETIKGSTLNDVLSGFTDIDILYELGIDDADEYDPSEEVPAALKEHPELEESINIADLNKRLEENFGYMDEPIEDEYEQIRDVLDAYADSENAFIDGFVTFEDLRQFDANNWLKDWSNDAIRDVALEMGYEVQDNKILNPSL